MVDSIMSRALRWAASIQPCVFQIKMGGYLNPSPTWSSQSLCGWPPTHRWCEIHSFSSQNDSKYFSNYPTILLGAFILLLWWGQFGWQPTELLDLMGQYTVQWPVFSKHTQIGPLMSVTTLPPSLLLCLVLLCLLVAGRIIKPRDK